MDNRFLYLGLIGFWLTIFELGISPVSAEVYDWEDYLSAYQFPKTFYYSNSEGKLVTVSYTGYKDQNNLNNSIVLCAQEDSCPEKDSVVMSYVYEGPINQQGSLALFKVFIPPGTKNFSLYGNCGQPSEIIVVAKAGSPPVQDYSGVWSISERDFVSLPYKRFSYSELVSEERIGRNSAGYFFVTESAFPNDFKGDWLYVQIYEKSGGVTHTKISATLDVAAAKNWFQAYSNWTSSGDPADPFVVEAIKVGDLDNDNDVDIFDYNLFVSAFGQTGAQLSADLDNDNDVDIFDYNLLVDNFGK